MVKVQKSQNVSVGALIVWDRGIRKVFKTEHHFNKVTLSLSDGSTNILPTNTAVLVHEDTDEKE